MCGIAGFLGDFQSELLEQFSARLATRGPDGHGSWQDRPAGIGLAHRRLSIIDLSTAASQPMHSVNGRYTVVFNGEIYNFKALQGQLGSYAFNRNSDTAVLAPLYDALGPAMLDSLEGMYAFAVWDQATQELWLARDHAGIKPLYYTVTRQGLAFASELKALTSLEGIDLTPDAAALADYLTLLWSPGERTPVRGIRKLPPGHWMKARRRKVGGVDLTIERWYWPPQSPLVNNRPVYDETRTPAQLCALLDAIVAEQCTSDVPVGAFLSGGVDSSALVASMVANARQGVGAPPAMTYCIGFAGQGMASEGFSEDMSYAKRVAKQLGVPLTPLMIEPENMLDRLPCLAQLLDEPTADPAPLFVQDICAQARRDGITVLLSGTGGDDVMSGYRRHQTARLRQKLGILREPAALALQVSGLISSGPFARRAGRLAPLLRGDDEQFLVNAFKTNSLPDNWQTLHPELRSQLSGDWRNALTDARAESQGQDLVNRLLYQEQFGFLPDHNLNYSDKASMASGVEVRVPLTDRRLMAFMAGVNPKNKLYRTRLKSFFKDSASHRIDKDILDRSKAGFGAPIRTWLTGPGRGLMEDTLLQNHNLEWFDPEKVRRLWQQTLQGKSDGIYAALSIAMCIWWREGLRQH